MTGDPAIPRESSRVCTTTAVKSNASRSIECRSSSCGYHVTGVAIRERRITFYEPSFSIEGKSKSRGGGGRIFSCRRYPWGGGVHKNVVHRKNNGDRPNVITPNACHLCLRQVFSASRSRKKRCKTRAKDARPVSCLTENHPAVGKSKIRGNPSRLFENQSTLGETSPTCFRPKM